MGELSFRAKESVRIPTSCGEIKRFRAQKSRFRAVKRARSWESSARAPREDAAREDFERARASRESLREECGREYRETICRHWGSQ